MNEWNDFGFCTNGVREITDQLFYGNVKTAIEIESSCSIKEYLAYGYGDLTVLVQMYDTVKDVMGTNQWPILHAAIKYRNMEFARHVYQYLMTTTTTILIDKSTPIYSTHVDTVEKLDMMINIQARSNGHHGDGDMTFLKTIIGKAIESAWQTNNLEFARIILLDRCQHIKEKVKVKVNLVQLPIDLDKMYLNQDTSIELVRLLFSIANMFGGSCWKEIVRMAIIIGRYDIVEYLLPKMPVVDDDTVLYVIDEAAKKGNLEMIQTILRIVPNEPILDAHLCACESGSLPVFQFLMSQFPDITPSEMILNQALDSGHWELAKYILENVPSAQPYPVDDIHKDLLEIEILDTLLQNDEKVECTFANVYTLAVELGRFDIVSHLDAKLQDFDNICFESALQLAIMARDLQMVQSIVTLHPHQNGFDCQYIFIDGPTELPEEMVRVLASSEISFSYTDTIEDDTLGKLIKNEFFSTITILVQYNRIASVSKQIFANACLSNNLEIVQLLYSIKGTQVSIRSLDNAIKTACFPIINFLMDHVKIGCYNAVRLVCQTGQIEMIKWLMTNANRLIQLTHNSDGQQQIDVSTPSQLDFILRNHSDKNNNGRLMKAAFKYNQLEMIKYLDKQHRETINCDITRFKSYKKISLATVKYLIGNQLIRFSQVTAIGLIQRIVQINGSIDLLQFVISHFNKIHGSSLELDTINQSMINTINETLKENRSDLAIILFDFFDQKQSINQSLWNQFYQTSIQTGNLPLLIYLSNKIKSNK
ncbi:hypothetical protein DFA_07813 [Cavenderia fasciculata]|uniref:Ankyrin repeat-containing protein n=1 Tax=Cavenderia fasciculata TaxID=261658 RepID=F4Q3G6_CACFS|nr:uncharacterized protein DFA_07813 [Cavenderia fasciculata]EGG16835.1 hypothetical protein DFA_07813 [Cavenderia fasciculata]|eukprot:XP_004355309.1 hypothetical protein DFA_07813 [Cavenderia fasciculata]